MTTLLDDDIIMKDCSNNNYNSFYKYYVPFSYYIRPRKRTFLEMLQNSNQIILNNRIDNYKFLKKTQKLEKLENNNNNKNEDLISLNYNNFNEVKKNLVVKRKMEYDEEKERKWVENYYKIKNAELNRLRFGTI